MDGECTRVPLIAETIVGMFPTVHVVNIVLNNLSVYMQLICTVIALCVHVSKENQVVALSEVNKAGYSQ